MPSAPIANAFHKNFSRLTTGISAPYQLNTWRHGKLCWIAILKDIIEYNKKLAIPSSDLIPMADAIHTPLNSFTSKKIPKCLELNGPSIF